MIKVTDNSAGEDHTEGYKVNPTSIVTVKGIDKIPGEDQTQEYKEYRRKWKKLFKSK